MGDHQYPLIWTCRVQYHPDDTWVPWDTYRTRESNYRSHDGVINSYREDYVYIRVLVDVGLRPESRYTWSGKGLLYTQYLYDGTSTQYQLTEVLLV